MYSSIGCGHIDGAGTDDGDKRSSVVVVIVLVLVLMMIVLMMLVLMMLLLMMLVRMMLQGVQWYWLWS